MNSTIMDTQLTLAPMLRRAATLFPDVEIVSRMPDRSITKCTYSEISSRAHTLAHALLAAGLQRGDRVATLMWNHSAHLEAYFGIPLAGGVVHTLNLRLPALQLAYIAKHAEDRFLIVDDVLLPLLRQFVSDAPFERVFVHATGEHCDSFENYDDFLKSAGNSSPLPQLSEYAAAAMCYTSGTTGDPKGVVYSHRALALHSLMLAMADTFAVSQEDSVLLAVPMFHANAWGLPFAATLVGAKQVLPGPHLDPESILELCEREQVTLANAVPTVWMAVCDELDKHPGIRQLAPGLRLGVGGAAPSESLIRRLDSHGIRLIHAWGMTETTPLATVSLVPQRLANLSSDEKYVLRCEQGSTVPFIEARVMSENGEVACDGKTMGEVQLRGPWVASSYFKMPASEDKWTEDGWFRTGDVVTISQHGYIRIVDRTKDLIKSGGEWISSVALENALVGHPGIKEAAVIAVPHPKWGERPLAIVVARGESMPTVEELKALLLTKFAKWQVPDEYVFVDELPHTSTGKLLKSELRNRFGKQAITRADPGSTLYL